MVSSLRGLGSAAAVVLAVAIAVAGCGTATTSTDPTTASSPPGTLPSAGIPSIAAATPSAVETPDSPSPSDSPATPSPTRPVPSSPAAQCSGTSENRDFFATVAGLVTWDVYCAVVPDGWYIESGRWRLKDGGRLDVAYHGPNGARIVLVEGVFCTDGASGCQPMDQHLGTAAFGDRDGNLGQLGGNLVLYVEAGGRPAWQATATGLDQATFVSLASAFFRVGS